MFSFIWDFNKALDNQMANLERHSKMGQCKPSSWMRKRGSEMEWLTQSQSKPSARVPQGSRRILLSARHVCPASPTLAKPLTGLARPVEGAGQALPLALGLNAKATAPERPPSPSSGLLSTHLRRRSPQAPGPLRDGQISSALSPSPECLLNKRNLNCY